MQDHLITSIQLPTWVKDQIDTKRKYFTDAEKMELAIRLSELNVEEQTGGPFGAAIFDEEGNLVSIGMNLVVPSNSSMLHAEVVAIMRAQAELKTFDLGSEGMPKHVLVSSAQPCVMCMGSTLWSGVKELIYGANKSDVEKLVGFDEGPVHPDWINELEKRGIKIQQELMREEARQVLKKYSENGGVVYNSRQECSC